MVDIEVTGLFVYPVKGLRGISLQEAVVQKTGLAFDRHWMVVMPNGRMVSQRQMPLMSCISTQLEDGQLILSASNEEDLVIDINSIPSQPMAITVWNDFFEAVDEGELASVWFSRVLASKYPLRLVRVANGNVRPQSKPELLGAGTTTHFADAAPYLLANDASLVVVNNVLHDKGLDSVPMNRFRPNIVVRGLTAFKEYESAFLQTNTGEYQFSSCYPCERCVVTTIEQSTGEVDRQSMQPLATLKEMNTAPGYKGAYFGQNITLSKGEGKLICLGDQLIWQ